MCTRDNTLYFGITFLVLKCFKVAKVISPLLVLRFIATIDADGVDGVELPQPTLRRSPDDGDGIVMEDRDEFILALVLIMDPVLIIDLDIKDPIPPILLSSKTLFGRTNFPRFGPHVK